MRVASRCKKTSENVDDAARNSGLLPRTKPMQLFAYLVTAAHLNWSLVFGRLYRIDLLDEQFPNG
eukprot:COSAG01_NODE_50220_length_365_cov_0.740602_1_plen_64_part_01